MEHILVIDDNRDIARMLAEAWLPQLGYRASVRHSGSSALKAVPELDPDLVLLDLQLPDVVGLDLLHDFRAMFPDLPLILMTAHGSERTAVEAFRLGIRNYLIKPFTLDNAAEAIDAALSERRLQREKERLTEGLRQRVRELTVLSSIGRSITALMDTDRVLTRIVDAGVYLTRAEQGYLLLTDPAIGELYLRAAKKLGDQRAQTLRMPIQDASAAQALVERKPVRITQRPGANGYAPETGVPARSLLQVPLLVGETAIGVLGVENARSARPFGAGAERLLRALADYGAIALENARLYRESRASEARYRDLFTDASDMLLTLDHRLVVQNVNAAAPRILGYQPDEIVKRPLAAFCAPDSWAAVEPRLLALLRPGTQSTPLALDLIRRDGARCFAEITARGIEDDRGTPGLFCSIRDLTERRLLEAQMVHAEKLAAMEQMVGGVAHELNNPLTSILGYTQLLLRDDLPEPVLADLHSIEAQATRAGKIVQSLTAFSRGYQPARTPMQLNMLVQAVAGLRAHRMQQNNIEIEMALAQDLPPVVADPYQMQQVLLQLLSNAHAAMQQEGGVIRVVTCESLSLHELHEGRPMSPVQLDLPRAVVVAVSDTGVGIERQQLDKIFDPFWGQGTPYHGSGLGLSMCYGIVTQHGGRIWAASQPGEGSTFYVALPVGS